MNELQKKVLIYLLNSLHEEVQHMSCDEGEISSLSLEERMDLTGALYAMTEDLKEWDGTANDEFSLSTLCDLALTWLGEPYRYARKK